MLTLVMAYYQNGQMLDRHLAEWASWPAEAREAIRIILVDDGSPTDPAEHHIVRPDLYAFPAPTRKAGEWSAWCGIPLRLYRVGPNIPWNQNGARNLAMREAPEGWCMMTDMDHLLTGPEALELVRGRRRGSCYYVPSRVQSDGRPKHRHPNSFILTREAYWRAGGYDEDFCGSYGSDAVFRRMLDTVAKRVELDRPRLVLFGREAIADASTTDWGRKGSPYHSAEKPHLVAKRRGPPVPATDHIRFSWTRVL